MTLTSTIFCVLCFLNVCFSLICFECDDPSDSSCKNPNVTICSEEETLCYTLSFHMSGLEQNWVLKGCTDNCENNSDCCQEDLCNEVKKVNGIDKENKPEYMKQVIQYNPEINIKPESKRMPGKHTKPRNENRTTGIKPVIESTTEINIEPEKEETTRIVICFPERNTDNGSEGSLKNSKMLIITFCVLLLINHYYNIL